MPKYKTIFQRSFVFTATAVSIVLMSGAIAGAVTTDTTVNVDVNSTIGISSDGIVNLTVTPTSGGSISSGSDTVRVTTSDSSGYTLTFSDSDADTSLSDGTNNLVANGDTQSSPGALDTNSWGYRVDGVGGFGGGTTVQETDVSTSAYTWAGVPDSSSAETIKTTGVPASNDQTKFWYAVKADQSLPSGTYSDIVTYTATAN